MDSLDTGIVPAQVALNSKIPSCLLTLFEALEQQKITYCNWKSTRRVQAALEGQGDIDLLVAASDQHQFGAILLANGFKCFPSVAGRDHPSIASYLGYDERSGRLIHLHVHFRLIIGEPLLKNARVPWEDMLLARAIRLPALPLRVLDPLGETLLLLARAALEPSWLDPIAIRQRNGRREKFETDRRGLAAAVDRQELSACATRLMGAGLAALCVKALDDPRPLEDQTELRRGLIRHFAPHRTYNSVEARVRSAWRSAQWLAGGANKRTLHMPRPWNRRAPGGGRVITLLGVDGSGKSTAVKTLRDWLGAEVDVMPIYFGTGDGRPSLLLWPLKILVPFIQPALRTKPKGSSHGNVSDKPPSKLYTALMAGWASVLAVEKRGKLTRAHRGAKRGLIVLSDRYPQDEIIGFNDGPLLHRIPGIPEPMRRFEAGAYGRARQLPPDLILRLKVTPETAAKREPNMDPAVIAVRIEQVQRLVFPGARVVDIDAEKPLQDVIRAVKNEVWRLL
jgi:hypothetical protein